MTAPTPDELESGRPGPDGTFNVAAEARQLGLLAAAIVFRNLTVDDESPAELRDATLEAATNLRARFPTVGAIRRSSELSGFRCVYARLSAAARRQQPGCERLVDLTWKRGDLPRINALVDVYNLVSIQRLLSIGAHDLDTLSLPVQLRLTRGIETFTPLSGTATDIPAGEFGYVDARNRLICRLDVLQADFSKITPRTQNALVIVESTVDHDQRTLRAGCVDLIELITRYCGGSADARGEAVCRRT